jgi:hypothetical protein
MGTHLFNRYEDRLRAESGGYGLNPECPFLAELRSSVGAIERLLWRKQTLKLDEAAAITDPEPTFCQITVKIKNRQLSQSCHTPPDR